MDKEEMRGAPVPNGALIFHILYSSLINKQRKTGEKHVQQ